MGRTPTPTAILDAKGTFIHHPEYKRPKEPKPKVPLSKTAPKDFSKEQKVLFKELMKMIPPGVAFHSDLWAARRLVLLEWKSREVDAGRLQMPAAELTLLKDLWLQFGLTPAARSKIQVEVAETDDLEDFLAGKSTDAVQ